MLDERRPDTPAPPSHEFVEGQALPAGVPHLKALYLYISGTCNLPCRHCWIAQADEGSNASTAFLRLEHLAKVVEQAKPLGLSKVKLTGGEPILHPQFREVVDYLAQAAVPVTIETNGTLVDAKCASFLRKAGNVKFISVSLDGVSAATHELLRVRHGSFESALNGIRALVEAGFRPQAICTLHRGNVHEVRAVVELAQQLGCGSVKFNHVQRVGRGEGFGEAHGLDLREIVETYRLLDATVVGRVRLAVHFDIPFAFRSVKRLLQNDNSSCGVREILGVLSDGSLSLCGIGVTVPELVFGHLDSDRLLDVWVGHPMLADLRRTVPFGLKGVCGECLHRGLCLGMCVADNYHRTKRFDAAYWFCSSAESEGLFPSSRRTTRGRYLQETEDGIRVNAVMGRSVEVQDE